MLQIVICLTNIKVRALSLNWLAAWWGNGSGDVTRWIFESRSLRLRLHGTGPEPFRTEPDRIGFCLHGTVWNRSRCLHGTFLEPVRIGSDTGPAKQQDQFWIRSGPVPERSRVNRRPIRSENWTGSVPDRSHVNIALLNLVSILLLLLLVLVVSSVFYSLTANDRACCIFGRISFDFS